MDDYTFKVDARIHSTQRPGYAQAIVSKGVEITGSVQALSSRCGITRQYIHALSVGQKIPSYAVQVCLEQLIDESHGKSLVHVDAPAFFRSQGDFVASLVNECCTAAGGITICAQRAGVSRQFLHALTRDHRVYRYPMQVLLEAIIAEAKDQNWG